VGQTAACGRRGQQLAMGVVDWWWKGELTSRRHLSSDALPLGVVGD